MAMVFVPSVELKELQQRGIINLENEVNVVGDIKIALTRSTFHPDESTPLTAWTLTTAYGAFEQVVPTLLNGHIYEALNAGTSGGGEPVFPTDGGTVLDGSIVWQDLGQAVAGPVTVCTGDYRVQNSMISGFGQVLWSPGLGPFGANFIIQPSAAFEDPPRRLAIKVAGAGNTDAVEPVWPDTMCSDIVDSGLTWRMMTQQAAVAQHPSISELEIIHDVTTVGYTLPNPDMLNPTLLEVGRSWVLDADDQDFGAVTSIAAGWAVAYINRIITDPVSGFWVFPPIGYALLKENRTDIISENGSFILDWNDAGIMRLR